MAKYKVYSNRALIESTLRKCGVDVDEPMTYHWLKPAGKLQIAEELSRSSDAPVDYCDWVIHNYFGTKEFRARITAKPKRLRVRL